MSKTTNAVIDRINLNAELMAMPNDKLTRMFMAMHEDWIHGNVPEDRIDAHQQAVYLVLDVLDSRVDANGTYI